MAAQKRAEEANLATIEANRASANADLANKKVGIDITAEGRKNAAKQQEIGYFAAGLQIGGSAASGYLSGRGLTSPGSKKINTSSSYITEN